MLMILLILLFPGEFATSQAAGCVSYPPRTLVRMFNKPQTEALLAFFPKELRGIARQSVEFGPDKSQASAVYGNNQFKVHVQDDAEQAYKQVVDFERQYAILDYEDKDSVIRFSQVRSGYKTLNKVDKRNRQCSITFVYENRYIIQIEGLNHQTPYRLWRYLELYKLKPMENAN